MDKLKARALLPCIEYFAEHGEIEYFTMNGEWETLVKVNWNANSQNYRIPAPFKVGDEVIYCLPSGKISGNLVYTILYIEDDKAVCWNKSAGISSVFNIRCQKTGSFHWKKVDVKRVAG